MSQAGAKSYDAVIVGSGPNGLSAAITLAEAGCRVLVLEAKPTPGGGARTSELTLPGFRHDNCSAVYPMAAASSFFRRLPLDRFGLEWIEPPAALAHPFDDGSAAMLYRSLEATAATLGDDGEAYRRLMSPWVKHWPLLFDGILAPLQVPRHPWLLARFGRLAIRSAEGFCRSYFKHDKARALFAGLAGHSFLPLSQPPSAAIGLVLGIAGHGVGWPIPRGGAGSLSQALVAYLRSLGGEVVTGVEVRSPADLPAARAVLFDLTPPPFLRLAGDRVPKKYRRQLNRFRYGPGVFKLDWALSAPIPWRAAECARAGTVHLGGTLEQIARSERAPWDGEVCEAPYVLLAQPSLFDSTRAPKGQHTGWAYCHVTRGSTVDRTQAIENQVERFAPGFRKTILARHVTDNAGMETHNANYTGGDISGGIVDFRQIFFRPVVRLNPYRIPIDDWYLCSASTPPGAGVHGMCGVFAARTALKHSLGSRS
jgi:phytoene dehydrogenase-like protein